MVRITKSMQAKHFETLSPWIKDFRNTACSISLPLLPQHLAEFPSRWPFSRGDLYHWISLLNRFDVILDKFCETYLLNEGPQTMDFGCKLLESRVGESEINLRDRPSLQELHYASDGDRQLIESILNFSRMLLENCGNRSIYASSSHLNSLLNTTSLSLLQSTLLLASRLAQRYQAALKRMTIPARHVSSALLANHYNIDLDRVLQLALPFTKTSTIIAESAQPATPVTPSLKGKEKALFNIPTTSSKSSTTTISANDLVSIAKGGPGVTTNSPKGSRHVSDPAESSWEEWGDVKLTYYPKCTPDSLLTSGTPRASVGSSSNQPPTTPTPIRRSSNLGPHGQRSNRLSSSDDAPPVALSRSATTTDDTPRPTSKCIEIFSSTLKSTGIHGLLNEHISDLAPELRYELLTKLRVAHALTSTLDTRLQILSIRLLAITNLAYIHSEVLFHETVLKQDGDEPRRLQLTYQLAELIHPPAEGDIAVPRPLQTIAFSALEALSQYQSKFQDVCAALNTNVNHGVLLYVVRKAVAELNGHDVGDKVSEQDEWREALLSLLSNVAAVPRTGTDLVTAGLIPILVEVLGLRTDLAERYHPKILTFLDNIMYSARDAFQTLVSAEGLDVVSDLIVFEVKTAAEKAASGQGMRLEYRSPSVDYEIPYFQQQTLKWLFKFIHHMMSTAGGYGGNFDRLLRNLIDSSQLLGGLRKIIGNSRCFGSIVWTNAVSILNDFINNEPTSFVVIAEAGLSRALLEAVTGTAITTPPAAKTPSQIERGTDDASSPSPSDDEDDSEDEDEAIQRPTTASLEAPREGPLARGIMPTSETINIVPQAFGAICLNNAGMKMFQASRALESFFEIFESPDHVKCMEANRDLPSNLGSTFDELVRHHPPLKTGIMNAILTMVARVGYLCKTKAEKDKIGAKLWLTDSSGKPIIADEQAKESLFGKSSKGKGKAVDGGNDVEMRDVGSEAFEAQILPEGASNSSMTPYVTAVATFLSAMFTNSTVRADFCTRGGIDFVLDLADSPCLSYDFADGSASRTLHAVIALLAEQKPHLLMPSLLRRAQSAADALAEFATHTGNGCFFAPFVNREAQKSADIDFLAKGTGFVKALVNVHSLVNTLHACFHASAYSHRSASTIFNQLNLADYYVRLVQCLGPLLGASIKEGFQIQKVVPDYWKNAVRVKGTGFGVPIVDLILGGVESTSAPLEEQEADVTSTDEQQHFTNGDLPAPEGNNSSSTGEKRLKSPTKAEQESPQFKNFQTIRYLVNKMSRTISPFFQVLGKALLVTKRNPDAFQKQSHATIAEALAATMLQQLSTSGQESTIENYSFWIGMVHVLKDMLIDSSRHNERPIQTITLVLQAFKDRGGFDIVNHILETFTSEIRSNNLPQTLREDNMKLTDDFLRLELAIAGTKDILVLYSQIVSGKNVTESLQTVSMTTRAERDRSRPDHFSPPQFLVELRMAVLPVVRRLWESDLIEKAPSMISERLIEVIRIIANVDSEATAVKRSDKVGPVIKASRKALKLNNEHYKTLMERFDDSDLANEALFRCNNNLQYAVEYSTDAAERDGGRNPVPASDFIPCPEGMSSSRARTTASTGTATPDDHTMAIDSLANVPAVIESLHQQMPPPPTTLSNEAVPQSFDQFMNQLAPGLETRNSNPSNPSSSVLQVNPSLQPQHATSAGDESQTKQVTVDDLNEERDAIRENLIDKCLDVINAHGEVTFEISDLITTVVGKSPDPKALRKVVGETLVVALMSFAGEDDVRISGKKVAAYAHLLALMLRDKQFYAAAVGELKDNLGTLLSFVKLSPTHSAEEPSPWISQILLIVEMLLSEDARPRKTKWSPPKDDNDTVDGPVLEDVEFAVSEDERGQLLESILDILPRIGKEESLALAVLRILVILTRTRSVAQAMGEKKNIQRLFVMAKQLAGASSARIQSPLMLILRHIIEDEETIKQIMRSDIKSFFDSSRTQRTIDTQIYLRGLSHNAIRAPQLFVEITNEMVKFSRWTYQNSDAPSRPTSLALKDPFGPKPNLTSKADDSVQPTVQATEDLSIQDVKVSTESADSEMPEALKVAAPEHKLPVVENPDGVIHFLLCELLNYKDVEDKDAALATANATEKAPTSSHGDVAMTGTPSTPDAVGSLDTKNLKTPAKQEFKPEEHPIYIYRCFLLQCLTELLSSYNRTKIEFINFKRSAPPQAMTPSKPRSSVVNYLLFDLIPIGTLDHAETTNLRKRLATSSWADSVLTALLTKSGEQIVDKSREPSDGEDEPDLLFVRRFVLENILKAYKEASLSAESLDVKYARMLSLADLMSHIINGKDNVGYQNTSDAGRSKAQLRRIMFEKGYIAALTASIADIDLNFPGAKRAVKYILRPLKILTQTAIQLSDLSLISSAPGQVDEEEIESATSVSDLEDEREETPDLFRNSTLGMFEPGREEDSSSESEDDDEEMYEGEYDEEMEYEEEIMAEDDEDNISDEDDEEDMDGMGPIEGLSGDHGVDVEVIVEDDDDEDDEDPTDDEDEDEHDSEDLEDDDARVEIIDEAGNIHIGEDDDLEEWESDDDDDDEEEEDYDGEAADHEEAHAQAMEAMGAMQGAMQGGPLGHLVRALGGDDGNAADILQRLDEGLDEGDDEEHMGGDYMEEVDDEAEDEEDDDGMDEDEMLFEPRYPDGHGPVAFGWESEGYPPMIISHRGHHHRPRNAFPNNFPFFPGGGRDPLGVPDFRPSYRSHRPPGPPPRPADDGTNPLLQRNSSIGANRDASGRPPIGNWIQAMGPSADLLDIGGGGVGRPFGDGPATAALLNEVIRSLPTMPGTIARNGQALQFHITTGPGHEMPPDLQAMFGLYRGSRFETTRHNPAEPGSAAFFAPQSTAARWTDEAKLLFGPNNWEKASDLNSAVLAVLVPPAIEADKALKAAEAVRALKQEEEARKQREEERVAREAREAEEKIAREKKEAEAREEAERAAAEALAARGAEPEPIEEGTAAEVDSTVPEAMDGVESETPQVAAQVEVAEETPAGDRPRVMISIRGSPFDITDLGIDAEFLRELPEEIREEVIMSAVAERRSQAAATGAQPSEIDQEFLDALPDDIRDEIIQQERQDRRRREREEQRRQQAAANGGGAAAPDMDAASILATLPPALRQQVLMEQDDEMIALLPPDLADQARAAQRSHPGHQGRISGGLSRSRTIPASGVRETSSQRPQRRAIVQMLDKSGVATLLRLMFILQHGSLQNTLNQVLQNVSLNRHNRAEVVSTLLHILQDGSADMTAVERSFAHLSLRAKQPKEKEPKTPTPLKRTLTGMGPLPQTVSEASPLMVVQQCLMSLVCLTQVNPHIPAFFLSEHDITGGLKRSVSRKGKGKDSKASKYALNSLLSLLDRDLIMESSPVMESLSTLLNMITQPLQALQRKQKEAAAEAAEKPDGSPSVADTAASVTSPETTTTTNEQPSEPQVEQPQAELLTSITSSAGAEAGQAPTSHEVQATKPDTTSKETEKKLQRQLTPPIIPEHNLKLVINIFVARECSSKTFRETISTIKNLSAIPGAKAVFGRELVFKAQGLGKIILGDLGELLPQIQKATTGTEIQGVALAKFSPGGSDQNKLLRVLTALDHLFDPKREKKDKLPGNVRDTDGESSQQVQQVEKQDLLSALYENSTFGPMWEKLSACLSAIRQREHMLNVATILLPLIEALMVVCKNTTLKDAPISRSQLGKEMILTSPPPESRMENLFFTFTEEHRKILNDLVRHTPKLMSGTFSLLVKNPKVLEFDNKRNYFSRSIHNRTSTARQSYPPLQLSVRRDQVFHDSFKSLYFQTGDQMKFGKLSIRFHGEEGVDAGGVTREWFQVLSRQMFDPGYALFIPVSSDRTTFHPNQLSGVNEEHLMFFRFIGRIIGKALYESRVLDCHFSRAVYKRILGKAVSVKDMESLDPDYYKSLIWMLENDITDIITETFSVDNDKFGVVETIDFIENGRNVAVNEENKHEYVRLMVEWRLTGSVKEQLDEFLKGFHEIIPAELVAIFNEQELELLISGLPEIDVDDWKSNTEYHNYSASSPQIQWFWRAVRSYDKEERAKLLQFVTGTSKVPLNGFKELEGMNGFSRFNIHRDYGNKDRLPSSHTCFNQLDLPEYENYEALRQQVLMAITAGSEYFGFA